MKYFSYLWQDEYRCECTAGIIMAENVDEAKKYFKKYYKGHLGRGFKIDEEVKFEEKTFKNNCCETFYG